MLERRVDKSNPKNAGVVKPFTTPNVWKEGSKVASYDAFLSTLTMMASMAVISTVPDAAAISLICSSALLINAKPFAPMKEGGRDMNSNAYASFCFALFMNAFLIARKLIVMPTQANSSQ
ncbi:uncharacterized protein MRET_3372 [Malassezia restricta]|uniref:Uncharacterized protein n=1 Tax=Malassezia restricta (strain ATCC 96810 / NBRC 103918 / CBS 7877) TaxID=425264 RepID=A0A3G2SAQ0_MALR7|nr:uncharacterized protein MRET_3372 [Malassezia restricta]AXA51773.1 uncharacterized protein MRET_3372 [Malassezia restricta]AYO44432.1 hypothetical protein DNF11_3482 [Malassezia restricta CBS 7877]